MLRIIWLIREELEKRAEENTGIWEVTNKSETPHFEYIARILISASISMLYLNFFFTVQN